MGESSALLVPLGVCAGLVALFVFRASPRTAFVAWSLVLFFVPIWVGATVGFFWAALTLMTLAAIVANLADLRLAVVDGFVAAFALLVLTLFALELATLSATVIAILQWMLPYAWGRVVLARVPARFVTRTIAAMATAAAVLALLEFATGINPFVLIPGSGAVDEWSQLQTRASFLRAEGAFGHSIALGASLAMSCSFVIAARWRPAVMLLSLLAVIGAIVVTFSRIGLVTAGLAIAATIVFLPGIARGIRWTVATAGALAAAVVVPIVAIVFADAGGEAGGSAEYRIGLLSLLSQVELLGGAGEWSSRADDGIALGAYAGSVDSTAVLIALRFGWVPMLLVAAALVSIAIAMVTRRANPAAIAVASQLPALFAVALITQFGMFLWFLAGLAVAWQLVDERATTVGVPADVSSLPPRHLQPGRAAAP